MNTKFMITDTCSFTAAFKICKKPSLSFFLENMWRYDKKYVILEYSGKIYLNTLYLILKYEQC